jgi:dihydrolipoamide dehydrogenase
LQIKEGMAFAELSSGGNKETVVCDKVLVAAGRRPCSDNLGLKKAGIEPDAAGRIPVNANYETSANGIYAIGDLIQGPMLAHKAMEEGVVAVERIAGQSSQVDYEYLPGIVYTWPEAAAVGRTEEQLQKDGVPYSVGRFPFSASGRARCMDEGEGFVKVLAQKESGRVLGIHIIGPRASDMIAEAVAVMTFGGTTQDIAMTFHAHPTLSEALKEAALDVDKQAIHA